MCIFSCLTLFQREGPSIEKAITLNGAAFDPPHTQSQHTGQLRGVYQTFASVNSLQQLLHLQRRLNGPGYQHIERFIVAVRQHGSPALIAALEVVTTPKHGDVVSMLLDAFCTRPLYVFARKLLKVLLEKSVVIVAPSYVVETSHLTRRRTQEVEASIQV